MAWALAGLLAACSPAITVTALPASATPAASATAAVVVAVVSLTATPEPTPLPFTVPVEISPGVHLSASGSYTQTETEAAGPMICQIKRDSCAFGQLVIDRDPAVLFSESEPAPYGLEDRMMHPSMARLLTGLAQRVADEWDGAQVMVTEAYDSLGQHDVSQPSDRLRYSLHFEGRSVDLIVWPPDTSRTGRLCALALEAGFAWVHNEEDHCHASIAADSLCFVCSGNP